MIDLEQKISSHKPYYDEMKNKGRLIPIIHNDRMCGFFTFYIDTKENEYKYNNNPWTSIKDDPEGSVCYIDQLITDNHSDNPKLAYRTWMNFKKLIKTNYPKVKIIRWNRWKSVWVLPKSRRKNV